MRKLFQKYIYQFNGFALWWIPGITIASTKLYEDGDTYSILRADGYVVVKSKTSNSIDMLPLDMVSEELIKALMKSIGINL